MDFNMLLKYIYNEQNIISKIKSYDESKDIEVQWPNCNLTSIKTQLFLPYKDISLENIDRLLQWTVGKILIFYYNHKNINNEIKVIEKIVHVFIMTLKICLLKYEDSNEVLCEKNVHLIKLISLFHYSRLYVDNERIEDIIKETGLKSFIHLHHLIFKDMTEFKDNFIPILGLAGLNYVIYQDKQTLTEHTWSKIRMNTRLLVNLIHEFFYLFLGSYSNDFSFGTPHRLQSLEGGYLLEKQIFGMMIVVVN
ncbi:unnamed protein product [Rotaria sp. Silwood2]|nr:unnamed protein product [Rotaria sp. Silwood2]